MEIATGCRSKEGANSVLKDLMARAEKVKATKIVKDIKNVQSVKYLAKIRPKT